MSGKKEDYLISGTEKLICHKEKKSILGFLHHIIHKK